MAFTGANVWAVGSEIAPTPAHVASISAIENFAETLAGTSMTAITTGVMVLLNGGSFLVPLALAGSLCIVDAFSYLFVVGKVEPLPSLANQLDLLMGSCKTF